VNKDFFTKPISLKDIKFNKINFKNVRHKKEIVIGILILVYIIIIFIIGNNLLKVRKEVKAQYKVKETQYNELKNMTNEEELRRLIQEIDYKKSEILERFITIETGKQASEISDEFLKNAPIELGRGNFDQAPDNKLPDYDIYKFEKIKFSGTMEEVASFLEYVKNYDKIARVSGLSISTDRSGRIGGQLDVYFYFRKVSE